MASYNTTIAPSHSGSDNPRGNPRRSADRNATGRTLETHAMLVRTQTQTIERLARKAGPGSRGRMNVALKQCEGILQECINTDGRYLEAMERSNQLAKEREEREDEQQNQLHDQHDQRAAGHRGLDVVA